MNIQENKKYTKEEYFSLVEESKVKLEYHQGKIYAMAGGTPEHNLISGNAVTALNIALNERDCLVYNSDQQIALSTLERYVYPDASVVCGEQEFENPHKNRLKNPILIVEVLSENTKNYDKTDKFHLYCSLPSFREYVLIHSDRILVETYFKEETSLWRISSAFRLDETIHLFSINVDIPLEQLYRKISGLKEGIQGLS